MSSSGEPALRSIAELRDLPIFPLNTVLFPGGQLPLRIFEQRYMDMAKRCLKENQPFGVCLIQSGREVGVPATPEPVGCTARIAQWDMQQLGVLTVITRGEQRFRIRKAWVTEAGLARANVELLGPDLDAILPEAMASCVKLLRTVIDQQGEAFLAAPLQFDSCAWVSARLTELLPLPLGAKQELLELGDGVRRIEILGDILREHSLLNPD